METPIKEDLQDLKELILQLRRDLLHKAAIEEVYLDNVDISKILKISVNTLIFWREQGILSYSRVGNKFFYRRADIDLLMRTNYYQSKLAKDFEHRNNPKK